MFFDFQISLLFPENYNSDYWFITHCFLVLLNLFYTLLSIVIIVIFYFPTSILILFVPNFISHFKISIFLFLYRKLYGWGDNSRGQLGITETEKRSTPQLNKSVSIFCEKQNVKILFLASGSYHVLGEKKKIKNTSK